MHDQVVVSLEQARYSEVMLSGDMDAVFEATLMGIAPLEQALGRRCSCMGGDDNPY